MQPGTADPQTFLAAGDRGRQVGDPDLIQMATSGHRLFNEPGRPFRRV
jgi:hypothetical protein